MALSGSSSQCQQEDAHNTYADHQEAVLGMTLLIIEQRDQLDDDGIQGAQRRIAHRSGNGQQRIHDQNVAAGGEQTA